MERIFEALINGEPEAERVKIQPIMLLEHQEQPARLFLVSLGLSEQEAAREVARIKRMTVGDVLEEAKAWMFLADRSDSTREAARAGCLLQLIQTTCAASTALQVAMRAASNG